MTERARKRRKQRLMRIQAGKCSLCGREKEDGFKLCPICREKARLYMAQKRSKAGCPEKPKCPKFDRVTYRKERYESLKAAHVCTRCGQADAMPGYTVCMPCNLFNNQSRSGYTGRKLKGKKAGTVC